MRDIERSCKFNEGDRVTWTHIYSRGYSITMTVREGVIEKRSHINDECFIVKYRGKKIRIHESHLRKAGERNTLTEYMMGRDK